jgi:hypothetical protein
MITDAVLGFFGVLIEAAFYFLPSTPTLGLNTLMTTATTTSGAGHTLFSYLGWANSYFPISDMITAIGYLVTLYGVMLVVNVSFWFYHQFWGS